VKDGQGFSAIYQITPLRHLNHEEKMVTMSDWFY